MIFKKNTCTFPQLSKFVHTWSPLAAVFNNYPKNNLKTLGESTGIFNVPELISYEGFYTLKEQCEQQTDKLILEAIAPHRTRKMIDIFDELSNTLCKVADLAEFIRIAHSNKNYCKAAEFACNSVSNIVEKLNTNNKLYTALKNVVDRGDLVKTTTSEQHIANLFLFDFEQCGIHLPENKRCEVVNLTNEILQLGQQFARGSTNPRIIRKSAAPENLRDLFQVDGDNLLISGLHVDSKNPDIREFAYRVYLYPEESQDVVLTRLLSCRDQLAKICGFETYSERALKGSLAENPGTVLQFLNLLSDFLKSYAEKDFELMYKMKMSDVGTNCGKLAPWDIPYYSYKIRRSMSKLSGDESSPYFSLGACMDGINKLIQSLYGISLDNVKMSTGESWHSSVYKLAVIHEEEGLLGYIYCDLYTREGKQNQDCHFTIQGGKELPDGNYQLPIVVLMLNFPVPQQSNPTLLTPNMVDNLFHEMGHAMHSMLGRTKYQHITGTRCSTDFAEVPSILMEYFANDPRVLRTFARHYRTGEPIPEKMLQNLCASKYLFAATEMQEQVFYSVLDQMYHGVYPLCGNTTTILQQIQNKYYGISYVPNTAWHLRFNHLVGYGAKYYSYLMSKAVASLIWQTYFEKDPFSRTYGDLYRYQCLNFGGGVPPKKLLSDFLQRDITPAKLVSSLVKELCEKRNKIEGICV